MSTSTWYWFYLQQAGGKRGFVEFWFMNDRLSSRSRNVSCTHTSMYEIRVYEQDSLNMSKLVFSCLSFHNIPPTFMVMALVSVQCAESSVGCWVFWCSGILDTECGVSAGDTASPQRSSVATVTLSQHSPPPPLIHCTLGNQPAIIIISLF